ncbi:hypothetical protein BOX15_Mlig015065g5 [Macrostomum lignano]|uniref:Uncharacterized protein n=1 Tax=Macrostomum lignano TaxID=282301 RepID=A0A267DJS2_9PLAT|nr:hypothetical protein BOX15_Mlig015065g5 [Macrostomum lignano]
MSRQSPQSVALLAWTFLLYVTCSDTVTASSGGSNARKLNCQTAYPAAKLLPAASCQPVPDWCRRLAGHGARSWRQCRARCDSGRLQFGDATYRISWLGSVSVKGGGGGGVRKKQKQQRMTLFTLAKRGWEGRRLTIWRGRVYARKRGDRSWRIVYQIGKDLVALPLGSKPPKNCRQRHAKPSRKSQKAVAAGSSSGGGQRLSGVRTSCHRNECTLRLSLRKLLRQAHRLMRRSKRDRRHGDVALRFVLVANGKRVRVGSAKMVLIGGGRSDRQGRRGQRGEAEDPAADYRRFLTRRREKYWRERGWKGGKAGGRGKSKRSGQRRNQRAHSRGSSRRQLKRSGQKKKTKLGGFDDKDRLRTMLELLGGA